MRELDLLLAAWVRGRYEAASESERLHFTALLELPDPVLARYLLGGERPDSPAMACVVAVILADAGIMFTV